MQVIRVASAAALAVLLSARPAAIAQSGQSADPKTGVIAGRVLDGVSKSPLDDAVVTLSGPAGYERRLMVDGSGRFAFGGLEAGAYQLQSDRVGYATASYGQSYPSGPSRAIDLRSGEVLVTADVRMWRFAAIGGRVVDERGEPLVRVSVTPFQIRHVRGARRLTRVDVRSGITDDRGIFRISGLLPGAYVLFVPSPLVTLPVAWLADFFNDPKSVSRSDAAGAIPELSRPELPRNVRAGDWVIASRSSTPPLVEPASLTNMTAFRPTFLGGADVGSAEIITIGAGEERTDIHLQLTATPGARLSGRIVTPDGPLSSTAVRLFAASTTYGPDDPDLAVASAITDGQGGFTLLGVPRGDYVLRAGSLPLDGALPAGRLPWWVEEKVTHLGRESPALLIQAQRMASIRGRIEQPATSAQSEAIEVVIQSAGPGPNRVARPRVDKALQFTATLVPGHYTVAARLGGQPCFHAIAGSTNAADEPLDVRDAAGQDVVIRCAESSSQLTGAVRLASGQVDAEALVVVFPTAQSFWSGSTVRPQRLIQVRSSPDGSFRVQLPAGEYFVAAIADAGLDWQRPAFLNELAQRASRINSSAGGINSVQLVRQELR